MTDLEKSEINKSYESGPIWEFANDGEINKDNFDPKKLYILWDEGYPQRKFTISELTEYFSIAEYKSSHWLSQL